MNTQCSIDWLSITTKSKKGAITPKSLSQVYLEKKGKLGYKTSYVFDNGTTHLWSDDRPEIHVIYSGRTLKEISEIMSIQELVQWHCDLGHRVSRIDTAIDIFHSGAHVTDFSKLWAKGNVKTRAKNGILISDPKNETGDTFYVGSLKKRRKLLRIYDKAKEQKVDTDWLRIEMQYGSGAAVSASKQIADSHDMSTTIKSQMRGYCDFKHEVWKTALSDANPISVSHASSTGLSNTLKWLLESVVPALTKQEKISPGITNLIRDMVHENIETEVKNDMRYAPKQGITYYESPEELQE